ncbi:hypothetical protein [Streptomyces sp. 029-5]|uniref:hypothetical protein n=1 Tax=Streptomyces sp. 029-5 TaxID=2789261 RepID=UPI0039805CC5
MSKRDPFAEYVAAQRDSGLLTEFLARPAATDLGHSFMAGQMTTAELVGLICQPRSGNRPTPNTGVAGLRELAASYRQKGWTQFADQLDAFAAEGEAILNT